MTGKNLGEILVEQGIINREALDRALRMQGRRLGEILIEEKLADPVAIAAALKFQARASAGTKGHGRLMVRAQDLDSLLDGLDALEEQCRSAGVVGASVRSRLAALRESVEGLLVEPLDVLARKMEIVAQQAAVELGKQVELRFDGAGLRVDRCLIDDISAVLLHLIRNALDHGLESSAQARVALGKPSVGAITVSFEHRAGWLRVSVEDDGQGLDEEKIYAKAVAKNLIQKVRSQVTSQELHGLLFTPGFSTSDAVSSISGRGVGLDVVEATAVRLGGHVGVESHRGKGARFWVSVPLRYATLAVLPVRVGSEWIAVQASEVVSVDQVAKSASDSDLALLSTASIFKRSAEPGDGPKSGTDQGALDTGKANNSLALVCANGSRWLVDEVGQPEIVIVREASSFAKGTHGVIGGAKTANGRNLLLLDLQMLASIARPVAAGSARVTDRAAGPISGASR